MFSNNVSQQITAAQKTAATNSINDLKLLFAWLLNLTPEDRKKILKMGNKSVAFVRKVLAALKANPQVVPASFSVIEFEKDLNLYDDMLAILMLLRPLFEGFGDTLLLLGSELMKQGNAGFAILKEGAKTNSALSETVKDIGRRYQWATRIQPTVYTIQGKQQLTLNGVVPLRQMKVLSGGPFKVFKGAMPDGDGLLLALDQPLKLPRNYTKITMVHLSDSIGVFSLIQK